MEASRRRFLTRLALITAGAATLRIWYILGPVTDRIPKLGLDDEFFYSAQARLVADGKGFLNPFGYFAPKDLPAHRIFQTAVHPPLYTIFLSLPARLGIDTPTQQRIITALLGCVTVVLIAYLARKLSGRDGVGLLAAGLAAVYPPLWSNDSMLGLETLYCFLVLLALLAVYRLLAKPTIGAAALLGLWLSLMTLTRSEGIILTVIMALPAIALAKGITNKVRWKMVGVMALIGLAVVGPWVVRNMTTFERPSFLGNGYGWVLLDGSCDDAFYGPKLGYWSDACQLKDYPPSLEETLLDERARKKAIEYLKNHKSRIPIVVAARVGRVFDVYRPFQNVEFNQVGERRGDVTSWLILIGYWTLAPFAIGGLVVLRRRRVPIFPFIAILVATTITIAMSFGITRYRAPIDAVIPVLAAIAMGALWQHFRKRDDAPEVATPDSPAPDAPDADAPEPVGTPA